MQTLSFLYIKGERGERSESTSRSAWRLSIRLSRAADQTAALPGNVNNATDDRRFYHYRFFQLINAEHAVIE